MMPAVIVPMGFTPECVPVGLEPTLIKLSGFEAVTNHRRVPATTPALAGQKFTY